jgi:hypothetical protein
VPTKAKRDTTEVRSALAKYFTPPTLELRINGDRAMMSEASVTAALSKAVAATEFVYGQYTRDEQAEDYIVQLLAEGAPSAAGLTATRRAPRTPKLPDGRAPAAAPAADEAAAAADEDAAPSAAEAEAEAAAEDAEAAAAAAEDEGAEAAAAADDGDAAAATETEAAAEEAAAE